MLHSGYWKVSFDSEEAALSALNNAGFSIGTNQRSDPRGLLFGDVIISKWRNLSEADKKSLHGHLVRHGPPGSPTTVTFYENGAPEQATRQVAEAAQCR